MAVEPKQRARLGRRLFAVDSPRVYYLVIPKCGCTFVKNVLWFLANGQYYHSPLRIHDADGSFLRASDIEPDLQSIRHATSAFTVLRNPVDRFLSLYFDKVVGEGRREYVPLYDTLVQKRSLLAAPSSVRDHQYNLECMAEWISENLRTEVDLKPESHWTPQSYRANIMREFDLTIFTVDELSSGLENILSRHVPNIREILGRAEMNRSSRVFPRREILTESLRRRINSIYSSDRAMYKSAKARWDEFCRSKGDVDHMPKFSGLSIDL